MLANLNSLPNSVSCLKIVIVAFLNALYSSGGSELSFRTSFVLAFIMGVKEPVFPGCHHFDFSPMVGIIAGGASFVKHRTL